MKISKHIATISTVIITTVTSAYAIERSAAPDQPKEKVNQVVSAPQALPNAQPKIQPNAQRANDPRPQLNAGEPLDIQEVAGFRPFLGVAGIPVTEALAAQLGLKKNVGLNLNTVARNSPASKAGLKKYDIITSLGGKNIRTQEDLRENILSHQPGKKLKLQYISKGERKTILIELGKSKTQPAAKILEANNSKVVLPKDFFNKFPPEQRERIRKMIEGNLKNLKDLEDFNNLGRNNLGKELERRNDKPQMFNFRFDDLLKDVQANGDLQGKLMMMDNNGSITLKSDKGGKLLELKDKTGKLQYSGPFNNEADKLKVPEKFRDRIKPLDPKRAFGKVKIMTPEQLLKLLGDDMPNLPLFENLAPMENNAGGDVKALKFNLNFNLNGLSSLTDGTTGNKYKLHKNKDGYEAEAFDKENNLLFTGPYNSDFDKNSVPQEFKKHFKSLKGLSNRKPFKLKLGQ